MSGLRLGSNGPAVEIGTRDAFHVPAVFVRAGEPLIGGHHVKLNHDRTCATLAKTYKEADGVVDPFMQTVDLNGYCWVLIRPDLVGDVQHHFEIKEVADDEPYDYDPCCGGD
jgi:hypothetical protein